MVFLTTAVSFACELPWHFLVPWLVWCDVRLWRWTWELISFSSFVGDGCGHTVLGPESGTLASINYPRTSPNSTVCEWEIRVKPGQRVQLKFGDFDIDDSDSCHSSYLRVHNGIGPNRTEIGRSFNYHYLRAVVLYRTQMYCWYFCYFLTTTVC